MSGVSAKSWEVDQQIVKDLWKSNGDLAAGFGKIVHQALEHYDKFKSVGQKISLKKGLPVNYAMPKHPFIASIIQGFININTTAGEVIPEALLTNVEKGLCGHADRVLVLDWENKICRVQDYKVNIGSEEVSSKSKALTPFDKLPANKITKYQLQMSFYANLLELSGWTVEGLDVFILENEWKYYKLDVLKVI